MAKSRNVMDGSFDYGLSILVGLGVLVEEIVKLFCIAASAGREKGKDKARRR